MSQFSCEIDTGGVRPRRFIWFQSFESIFEVTGTETVQMYSTVFHWWLNLYPHIIHTVHFFLKAADLNGKTAIVTGGRSSDGSSVEGNDATFSKRLHETQICLCEFRIELCLSGAGPLLRREHWICYSLETLAFGCHCGGDDPLSKGLLETLQSRGGRHLPLCFFCPTISTFGSQVAARSCCEGFWAMVVATISALIQEVKKAEVWRKPGNR